MSSFKNSIMMSVCSENGGGSLMFSDMDLSEKLDPKEEVGEGSCQAASKMFSSSVSSSLFLRFMEEIDVPTSNTKYNDISCAPITLKAALGATVHQSCVDLPEQDFDADLMRMTASFQKQMSVSSAASEDELTLLKSTSGHSATSSFLLFDIDSLATTSERDRNKELLLDSTQDTGNSVSSSESTKVATNETKKSQASINNDDDDDDNNNNNNAEETSSKDSASFVFPDCDSQESEDGDEEEKNDQVDEDVTVVGVVKGRGPPQSHNTRISSPTPAPIKITGPIELNWVTPSESRPAMKIVNMKHEEEADLTVTTGLHYHHDSFMTCTSNEEQRFQNYLYHPHHQNPQPHFETDCYHYQHQTHLPSEYQYNHRLHCQGHWDAQQLHPHSTNPPSFHRQDGEFELPDEYIQAAERLRESMARSRMSRTAVVRHNSSESVTSSCHTANSGALLRERHLPQPSIRRNDDMPSTSPLPTLVTPTASGVPTTNPPPPHHHYNYDTMNDPVFMEPEIRFLRTDGTPAFPSRFRFY